MRWEWRRAVLSRIVSLTRLKWPSPRALNGRGLAPEILANYYEACERGWALAPTNAAQKAIWKKVHQIPDKPITIEYDPKKDK